MTKDYQKAPLRVIFDANKEDSRRKTIQLEGGHKIDSDHLESCSLVAQSISARLILEMDRNNESKVIYADSGKALPSTLNNEKGACDSW